MTQVSRGQNRNGEGPHVVQDRQITSYCPYSGSCPVALSGDYGQKTGCGMRKDYLCGYDNSATVMSGS